MKLRVRDNSGQEDGWYVEARCSDNLVVYLSRTWRGNGIDLTAGYGSVGTPEEWYFEVPISGWYRARYYVEGSPGLREIR